MNEYTHSNLEREQVGFLNAKERERAEKAAFLRCSKVRLGWRIGDVNDERSAFVCALIHTLVDLCGVVHKRFGCMQRVDSSIDPSDVTY